MSTFPTVRLISRAIASRLPYAYTRNKHFPKYLVISSNARFQHNNSTQPCGSTQEPLETPRPEYELTFTCKPCKTRSTHRISKQGYHYGSVLIACPQCKNRHIISDHLNIFGDRKLTIEDLMREQGQLVKKGSLSEDETFEIWADGSCVRRAVE